MSTSTLLLIVLIGLALFLVGIAIGTLLLGKRDQGEDPRVPELTAALQARETYVRDAEAAVHRVQSQLAATTEQLRMMEEQDEAAPRTEAELSLWRSRVQHLEQALSERDIALADARQDHADGRDTVPEDVVQERIAEAVRAAEAGNADELDQLRRAEADREHEADELRARLEAVEAEHADRIATLRFHAAPSDEGEDSEELRHLRHSLAEQNEKLQRERDEIATLKATLYDRTSDLDAERDRIAAERQQFDALRERFQSRESDLDETRDALAQQREELEAQRDEHEAQREQLIADQDALDAERALHRQQLDDLREREDDVERRLSEAAELEQTLGEQRDKLAAFTERIRQGEATLRQRIAAVEARETETNEHASVIESERTAVLAQRQEILDYKATVDQQQHDVDRSRDDLAEQRKRMDAERDAMQAREAQLAAQATAQEQKLQATIDDLGTRLEAQGEAAERLREALDTAQHAADDQRLTLQRHIDDLTSELDLRTTQLQRMETRTQAAEGTVRQQQAVLATTRPGHELVHASVDVEDEPEQDEEAEAPSHPADDLTQIPGVTLALQQRLFEQGVTQFDQIGAWSGPDARKYALWLGVESWRVLNQWVPQARQLAARRNQPLTPSMSGWATA